MPLLNYHKVRYASSVLYTYELVVVAAMWVAAVAAVAACWYSPAFLSGGRVIGALQNGTYVPVGLPAQLTVFYGYSIVLEAAGFYLPVYVIIRMLGLV